MGYDTNQSNIALLAKEYAEGTKRTVFFVGAGASSEVGMPTWTQLREGLLSKISSQVDIPSSDKNTVDNFRELEDLSEDNDQIWRFFSESAKNWPTTYSDFMEEQFDEKVSHVEIPTVYNKLWGMKKCRQIFTLNIDGLVSRSFRSFNFDPNKKTTFGV